MRRSKTIIAGIGLAAALAVGGVSAAAATGSQATSAAPARSTSSPGAATVRTARATVGGKTEAILVNAQGLPLYYYLPDSATRSLVSGGLARLWPPLTSAAPVASGLSGRITVVSDAHGSQVAYNGHLLYTFTGDRAGQVAGQGFQNFFVATPGLAPIGKSSARATTPPSFPYGGYPY